ncbi:hypothetical protein RJD23_00230 [Buchnera aphidicola (Ceratoglyphina bambusae)]|uniref:hypothetical protein n=1 Tax=Buchnera aphidicola TaxID=9 RepID=UPI0031B854FC
MKKYLVGGAVRNGILGLPIKDRDWVITGSNPKILISKKYKQVGKKFPVFLHPVTHEEYALARTEKKNGTGYKGFKVNYSSKITLEEDLIRRDITINAIAKDKNGTYFDPYNGLKDIKKRIIRHISSSFSDDPLRVLRVARFAALLFHLGFRINKKTLILMSSNFLRSEILNLEKERVWQETEKAFKTFNPHIYFQVLFDCKTIYIIFPEIYNLLKLNEKFCTLNDINFTKQKVFQGLAFISKYTKKIDIRISFFIQLFDLNFNIFISNNLRICFLKFFKKYVLSMFVRINVPNKIKNLSILFIKNKYFLININVKSSHEIVLFLNKINAWRNPNIINKLSFLVDFYIKFLNIFFYKKKYNNFYPGNYLKKVFKLTKIISFSSISKNVKNGIEIQNKINELKKIAIENWRNSLIK